MNKLFIIIMISFLGITTFAQERFYSLYDGWAIGGIHVDEYHYITRGLIGHPTTDAQTVQFNFIGFDGTQEDTFNYINDTSDGFSGRLTKNYLFINDTVVFAEGLMDYSKNYTITPALMFYNLNTRDMDTITTYTHCVSSEGLFFLLDTIDSGFISTGNYRYENDNVFPLIIFTDNNSNSISVKTYDFTTDPVRRIVTPYQLLKLPDDGFLLSCQDEIGYYNYHGEIQRTCFMRLDNNGDELWRSYTTTQDTITVHPFAALMPDGDYLIAWSDPWLAESVNPNKSIWLARMTDEGIIYNKKKISDDIIGFESKSYLINDCYQDEYGNVFLAGEAQLIPFTSFLLKIDTLGIAKWHREYECFPENDATFSYSRINGITRTIDGGFIMGGEYYSDPSSLFPAGTQQGLVIKVDSMGCLTEGCEYVNIKHTINALSAGVYPNPARDKITISISARNNNAHVKIYDIKGCLWVNIEKNSDNIELDISQLPTGIYTTNIWADGKFYVGKFAKE